MIFGIPFVLLIFSYSCKSIFLGFKKLIISTDNDSDNVKNRDGKDIDDDSPIKDILFGIISLIPVIAFSWAIYTTLQSPQTEEVYYYGGYIDKENILDVDYYGSSASGLSNKEIIGVRVLVNLGEGETKTLICNKNLCDLTMDYTDGVHMYYKDAVLLREGYAYFSPTKVEEVDGLKVSTENLYGED